MTDRAHIDRTDEVKRERKRSAFSSYVERTRRGKNKTRISSVLFYTSSAMSICALSIIVFNAYQLAQLSTLLKGDFVLLSSKQEFSFYGFQKVHEK